MSEASDLIERMERETGQRVDSNGGDNMAIAGLFGSMAREMGGSRHAKRDDVAAGVVIRHQMSPEGKAEQGQKEMLACILTDGVSPDTLKDIMG